MKKARKSKCDPEMLAEYDFSKGVIGKYAKHYPQAPKADADGHYPASETIQVIIAQQIIQRRRQAGLSQAELAKRAGVREVTIARLESGKHAPNVRTVEKIDLALTEAGA